ncbi:RUS family member 1 isoform X4 [Octopus sinensis]|uniref:RUS family member 1 isoform X4 n=1 Tax=Octopus sinensis TaxID=2607531 RepID=A0A7E6FP92_9MOLL|nr:RUS family member 1 isoform X4 [Octopus sinensis]
MCSCSLQRNNSSRRSKYATRKDVSLELEDYYHLIDMEFQNAKELPEDDVFAQLAQKDRDLILAAELGKALLEKNDELLRKNETLVEEYTLKIDELEQERHALRLRLESLEAEYENTVKELQDDVNQLRQDLQGQQQQLTAGDKDKVNIIRELTQQNERLSDQVQHAAEMEGQLVSEVEGLRSQVSLRMSMPDQLDQLDALHAKINELTEKKCEIERKIHVLTEERDSYACSLEESQERILMLEKQKLEQELHIRNQGREIYELQEVNHQLQAQIENLSQRTSYGNTGPPSQTLFNELSGLSVDSDKEPAVLSVQNVFLPQGYPESVSEDYLSYQIWDSIQAFASSITGTLATQSVLKGIGVGNEQATVLGATLTWLLKDCTGMMGQIIFAWVQGTNLDCNAKRYRLLADILNDVAIFLDILASLIPAQLFIFMVCLSSLCRSIVGIAGASTRAALSQHQARRNNMADVSVKDSSQETLVNVTALLFNLILTPFVSKYKELVFYLFTFFTMLHLYSNYSAIKSVTMETINQSRLCILVQEYLRSSTILNVKDVNMQEPVIFATYRKMSIHLGCSINRIYPDESNLANLKEIYKDSKYLVFTDLVDGHIYILLCNGSTVEDQLEGCFQAEVINAAIDNLISPQILEHNKTLQKLTESARDRNPQEVMKYSFEYTKKNFENFKKLLQSKNWITDHHLLGADEWRVDLMMNKKKD